MSASEQDMLTFLSQMEGDTDPLDALADTAEEDGAEETPAAAAEAPETEEVAEEAASEEDESDSEEAAEKDADAPGEGMDVEDFAAVFGVEADALLLPDEGDEEGAVRFQVTVDGEKKAATLPELIKSYQLDSSLYGKHEQVSQELNAAQQQKAQLSQQYQEKLQKAEDYLKVAQSALSDDFESVNWADLEARDPGEAALQRQKYAERYQGMTAQLEYLQSQRSEEQQRAQVEQEQYRKAYQAEQYQQLIQAIPEFADQQKAEPLREGMRSYLMGYGFTEDEVARVMDHRLMKVIHDGLRFSTLATDAKPDSKRRVKMPKRLRAGSTKAPETRSREKAAAVMKRVAKTGSDKDAAAAFLELGIV
jgi:hypothetical protein